MVHVKNYNPTNKKFTRNLEELVGTRTRKGHLNSEERTDKVLFETGELKKIIKDKIDSNGWVVDVDGTIYKCIFEQSIMTKPECTESELYLIPKQKTVVNVSLDKESKIYKITSIIGLNVGFFSVEGDATIVTTAETDTSQISIINQSAEVNINNDGVNITHNDTEISISDEGISLNGEVLNINNIKITMNPNALDNATKIFEEENDLTTSESG